MQPRIGRAAVAELRLPIDAERVVAGDADLAAQAVHRKALDQVAGGVGFAIDQQLAVAGGPDEEIEQRLALGRQQAGPGGQLAGDVLRDQALQEIGDVLLFGFGREADQGAGEEAFGGHG